MFPIILIALCILFPWTTFGQFNGDFSIERHYLDEENFLDWRAYQHPISWRYAWHRTTNGMRATVGSISQERFIFNHEIRLEKPLTDVVSFQYEQRSDSFYAYDPLYHEAGFRFGSEYFASIIGFPH